MPDLNNNGISEIVAAYYENFPGRVVLENYRDGALVSSPVFVNTAAFGVASLDAGDLDGDGDLDIVVTLQPSAQIPAQAIPYLNTGSILQPLGAVTLLGLQVGERVHDVELADLSGNGSASLIMAMANANGDRVAIFNFFQTPLGPAFFPANLPLQSIGAGGAGAPSSLNTSGRARITIGDVNGSLVPDVTLATGPVGGPSAGLQMFLNGTNGTFPAVPTTLAGAPYDAVTDLHSATLDTVAAGDMVFADPLAGVTAFQTGLPASGILGAVPPTSLALNAAGFIGIVAATTDIVATNFIRPGFGGTGVGGPQDVFSCDSAGRITGFFNDQAPPPPIGAPATFNTQVGTTPLLTLPGAPILNSIAAGNIDNNALTDFATCSRGGILWRLSF